MGEQKKKKKVNLSHIQLLTLIAADQKRSPLAASLTRSLARFLRSSRPQVCCMSLTGRR